VKTTLEHSEAQIAASGVRPGQRYRHFKGAVVEVVCACLDEANCQPLVVYRHVEDGRTWARHLESFVARVPALGIGLEYVPRFELIGGPG
jgi:hypothetical protein